MTIKIHADKGKTITELIQGFTERSITRRGWNRSGSIVDQNVSVDNVLSNPHRNNCVSKVLGILLSDFVSRGSECSLWRHHCHENKQLKSAQWASSTGLTAVSKFKLRLPAQWAVGTHRKGPSRMEKVTSRMNWPMRNLTQIRIRI